MNFIKKILKPSEYNLAKSLEDMYKSYSDEWEFVWGVVSGDSVNNTPSLYSLNDLDITFNKIEKKYYLSVETIYMFDNERAESLYIQDLYEQFTQYMYDRNLSVNKKLSLDDIFSGMELVADDLETLYAQFKFLVKGYLNMNESL